MRNGALVGRRRGADVGGVKHPDDSTARRSPATQTSEHIATVAKFAKNNRGETIQVRLSRLNGTAIANVRTYFVDKSGNDQPTRKGLALIVSKLPELADALNHAVTEARRLGLLPEASR